MRIAVISDIHGNSSALADVLDAIETKRCDKIVCLGDVVGYGYDPHGCIELCKKHCDVVLKGNHDAAVSGSLPIEWFSDTARQGVLRDQKRLSDADKEWLRGLDYQHVEELYKGFYVAFSHGTFTRPNEFEYVDGKYVAGMELSAMREANVNLAFVGHTHEAMAYGTQFNEKDKCLPVEIAANGMILVNPEWYNIINVGSVGYPRVQDFSSYVILSAEEKRVSVEFCRLGFDMEKYADKLKGAGVPIPGWLGWRLDEKV